MQKIFIIFVIINLLTCESANFKQEVAEFLFTAMFGTIPTGKLFILMAERKDIAKSIFDKLNEYRSSLSLDKLTWNDTVYDSCLEHTFYQAKINSINHDNFSDRVKGFNGGNENVAMNQQKEGVEYEVVAEKFMNQWKNSSGHDKNMKATNVDQGAVAVVSDGSGNSVYDSYYSTMINVKA